MNNLIKSSALALWFIIAVVLVPGYSFGLTVEGFLEPNQIVDLVPPNRDTVKEIHVAEGDVVQKGQILITLDDDVLQAHLKSAEIQARSKGRMQSSKAVFELRKGQFSDLEKLSEKGHVRKKELERAKTDLAIGHADYLAAQEEIEGKRAEVQLIQAQIDEKKIKAPFAGIVTAINKGVGALVGTSDKDVLITLVQPTPYQAVFHLPYGMAAQLQEESQVLIGVIEGEQMVNGKIIYISPVIDPESATVRVKVRLDETESNLQSGLRCQLNIE